MSKKQLNGLDNMYFVYSLSIDGHVFYIGKCKNLAARYSAHISKAKRIGYDDVAIIQTIRKILASGRLPLITAIYYLTLTDALNKEKELIQLFSICAHQLSNNNLVRIEDCHPKKFSFTHSEVNIRKMQDINRR